MRFAHHIGPTGMADSKFSYQFITSVNAIVGQLVNARKAICRYIAVGQQPPSSSEWNRLIDGQWIGSDA